MCHSMCNAFLAGIRKDVAVFVQDSTSVFVKDCRVVCHCVFVGVLRVRFYILLSLSVC